MKFLFVTTISNTVNAFLIPHIEMLVEQGHKVDLAFNQVQEVNKRLLDLGCEIHQLEFERVPLNKNNILALNKLKKIVRNYDVIHTHTPIASACVRVACRNTNVKVIYTAHGFHFHKGAPLQNWLIYYPLEKVLSKYTDTLITINKEDYERANKKFSASNTVYVPGIGLNLSKFNLSEKSRSMKRKELDVSEEDLVLLSIGELNNNKNHKVVINAISKLKNKNVKYFICGIGPLENELKLLIKQLGLESNVILLGFRPDIAEICNAADVFVFPSFREGLPVSVMEAMACGLPIVASNIRGNQDLVIHGKGGYLVSPENSAEFTKHLDVLLKDDNLRSNFGEYNMGKISNFSLNQVLCEMKKVYDV